MKHASLVFFIFLAALGLCAKEVIKIGVILPLTGNNAQLGEPIRELIEYKVDHFPKNDRFEYRVVFDDDQLLPKESLLAAHRLVELEHVNVLITFFTAPAKVVAPYAAQKNILHLCMSYDESMADGKNTFDDISSIEESVRLWFDDARKQGYQHPAFLVHRNAGGEMVLKTLEKLKSANDPEWAAVERFNQGERDFRSTLLKLEEKKPDVLFLYAFEPELEIILRQIHEEGLKWPLTTILVFEIDPKDEFLEGARFVSFISPTPQFRAWYQNTFGTAVPLGAPAYSDWVELTRKACEAYAGSGKPSTEVLAGYLREIKDFDGAAGKMSMTSVGVLNSHPQMLVIKNGVPVPLEASAAATK